jgi:oligoribonuclease
VTVRASNHLVWIDLEMSGLDPDRERILEIATVVTNAELAIVAEGPEIVIHQSDSLLEAMDDWNRRQHGASGLADRVRGSSVTEAEAERRTLEFVSRYCEPKTVPLAGNSVSHDRRFLLRYMPRLEAHFSYRNVDVSSVKELVARWYPEVLAAAPPKKDNHRALDDIRESIEELRYYRRTVFRETPPKEGPDGRA